MTARGTVAGETSAWFAAVRPAAEPTRRLLMFPHAGAGAHALNALAALAPADTEVVALSLPGRDTRYAEPPQTSLTQVLAAVDEAFATWPALPTVYFGCSVGALLAIRTAARRPELCRGLVLASQTPGGHVRRALQMRGEEDLVRLLRAGNQTPEVVLEDPDFRAALIARLEADLELGREAERGFADVRVPVPVTVFGGLEDQLVPAALLPGWAEHAEGGACRVVALAGGHFAFLEERHDRLVRAALRTALDEAACG